MGLGKTYSTKYLLDSNNSSGVAGQVLSTTSTGIDWVDANTVPGSGLWLENGNDIYNSNSGNVGIGVTSPGAKFQVYSTATRDISIFGHGTQAQNTWQAEHAFFTSAGQGVIIGKANASNDTNRLYIFYNDAQGNAEQYIYNTSNTATIKLDSAGDSYFNGGNVGIGVTGPQSKLHVVETGSNNTAIFENSGQTYNYTAIKVAEALNNKAVLSFAVGNALASTDIFGEISGSVTNNGGALTGDLVFKTNPGDNLTERMRIFSNGNVNIGVAETGSSAVTGPFVVTHSSSRFLTSSFEEGTVSLSAKNNSNNLESLRLAGDSIKFFNGTNTVGSQKMVILSSGNVGIGTTGPSSKLVVADDSGAGLEFIPQTSNNRITLLGYDRTASTYQTIDLDASELHFNISGTERMRIDSSGQARIGIGGKKTSIGSDVTPTTVLTVFDIQDTSSYSGINIKQYNDPFDNQGFFGMINCVGGTFNIVAKSTGTIKFMDGQSSATNMEISGTGAIKFNNYDSTNNTGTPTYLLGTDASGNVVKTTSGSDLPGGPYLPIAGGSMTGNTFHGDNVISYYGDSNDLVIVHDGSNAYLKNTISGNLYLRQEVDDADVIFQCDNGSGGVATYLTLDGSTTHAYFSNPGNVGIGYTAPDVKLVLEETPATIVGGNAINGSTMKGIKIRTNLNGDESVGLWFGTNGSHWSGISGQRKNAASTWGTTLSFYTHEDTAQDLTYSRERMLITSAGNVGIGTDDPLGKLMVRDDTAGAPTRLIVSNGGTAQAGTTARLSFYEGTSEKGYIERRRDGSGKLAFYTPADDNPFVWENPSGEIMRINNGNVGIGVTNPSSYWTNANNLVVGGLGAVSGITIATDGNLTGSLIFADSTAAADNTRGGLQYNHSNDSMLFRVDNATKMTILSNGNVGIGSTASSDINDGKLLVNGTLVLDQTSEIKYGKNNGGPYLNIRSKDGSTSACGIRIHSAVGSPGYFYGEGSGTTGTIAILDGAGQGVFSATQGVSTSLGVNNSTRLFINNSGNVGINTTDPQDKLEIKAGYLRMYDASSNANAGYPIRWTSDNGGTNVTFAEISGLTTSAGNRTGALYFNTSNGGAPTEKMRISAAGAIKFNAYGAGTLVTDASGNITASSGGGAGGPFLPLAGGTMSGGIVFSSQDGATCTPVNWLSYLCPDSSGTTVNAKIGEGVVIFPDSSKVTFGDGQDLEIYHDGGNSYIKSNTGWLNMPTAGSGISMANSDFSKSIARFLVDAQVELYYNGTKRFETTSAGVTTTGTTTTLDLAVTGVASVDGGFTSTGGNTMDVLTIGNGGLKVVGPGSYNTFRSGNDYTLGFLDSAGTTQWWIKAYTNGDFALHENGSGDQFNIQAGGNVGIGVTAPSEKLEVNSGSIFVNGENNGIIVDSVSKRVGLMKYSGHEGVIARASTVDFGIVRCATSDIFDGSSLTYDLYVSGTGNVGIGTVSPDTKLMVSGEILSENTNGGYFVSTRVPASSTRPTLNFYGTALDINYVTGYAGTGTDTAVSILTNGNVGIGVTGPDVKLHVTESEDGSGIDKGTAKFINTATGSGATTMHIVQTTADSFGNAIKFWQGATPTAVGFIRLTTSATQFITSASDLNLKKNITNWSDDTLSKFKALEPKKFRFKTQDASEDKTLGFIAQNEVDNFPEAYPQFLGEDEKPYYGFNPSGMVPHLMKAIKDLVEKVEILENKITQLEN